MPTFARLLIIACLAALAALPAQAQRSGKQRAPAKQEQVDQGPRIDAEAVIYKQRDLIEQSFAHVAPTDAREPSLYFVGFAGWALQDVFVRELVQVRDIVEERLGTAGRSILLVNHPATTEEAPLANGSNLDLVLARLARLMSVERDTLVLFMTSHGLPGQFAVHFPGLPLNQVTPASLRESLDRSGIRNRIIIISSCFSGSFIPALRDAGTLIMTAARADRSSFGCSQQRAWTYFGDALFNRALRQTTSLTSAFETARGLVREWEAKDKLTPSEPQIFVGERIVPVIERIANGSRGN